MMVAMSLLVSGQSQSKTEIKKDSLYFEILQLDREVFGAFNKRDVKKFAQFFDENLEFFHDKGGLTGYKHTVEFLETLSNNKTQLSRELIEDSLIVYPIPGYGAMQIGAHRFCNNENVKTNCGIFNFIHIWRKQDGKWKITRVVSYGH